MKMKGMLSGALVLASAIVVTAYAAETKEKKACTLAAACDTGMCPCSGQKAAADVTVDYNGGKVHFCCAKCAEKFSKDPAKYMAKANMQLVATGQAKQIACPLTGKPAKDDITVTVAGAEIHLCCGGCKAKLSKAAEAKQIDLVYGKNFDKGFKVAAATK
jgi:YHS domain-containing protein